MSDFDKEAERERLEERFAEEQERRAETAHMSELLLQGATMTDTHCEDCGSPIFSYEGQSFCPTCQQDDGGGATGTTDGTPPTEAAGSGEATGAAGAARGDEPTAGGAAGAAGAAGVDARGADRGTDAARDDRAGGVGATPDGNADAGRSAEPAAGAGRPARERDDADAPTGRVTEHGVGGQREPPSRTSATDRGRDDRGRAGPGRRETPVHGAGSAAREGVGERGDALGEAEASLARTLRELATAAEEGSDLGRTHERLAAAREAAEAIAAVRQAER
jgi:hypothetical protein